MQQARNRKAIAAVVAGTCHNADRPLGIGVLADQPIAKNKRCAVHQFYGGNRLILNGVIVPGANFFGCKNFHDNGAGFIF